ncbi:hypothetical protein C1645_818170 [Glomus cerebriforme]|uniref:Uncharacterized protein n=1 Tax=Glomus cerebriforme TaxID=658196 RepID=A0A397TH79_9GLOM|nr:hypothetical protein C1645_818170 [Glomus cerebriforme]
MERGKHYEKNKKRKEKKKEKLLTQERLFEDISKSLSDIKEELENNSSIKMSKLNDLEIKLNRLNEVFKNSIVKLEQENKKLKQEIVQLNQKNDELNQKIAELNQEVAELKQKLKIVQNELDTQKIYSNYRDWVSDLNFRLEIKMKVENLYGTIVKERMVQEYKNLPLDEGLIVSQLKEILEKAKVGFTFQQYMKLQEFRRDGNFLIHIERGKSIDKAREELRNAIFPSELKHLKAPLYKLFDLLEVVRNQN